METWDQWKQRVGWQDINQIVYRLECQIRDLTEEAEDILYRIDEVEARLYEDDMYLVTLTNDYDTVLARRSQIAQKLLAWGFVWDDDRQCAVESDETST